MPSSNFAANHARNKTHPTVGNVAAQGSCAEIEKGWVNQQLFVEIALRTTRTRCVWLCLRLQMAVIVDSHITDIGGQVEDGVYEGALPSLLVSSELGFSTLSRFQRNSERT